MSFIGLLNTTCTIQQKTKTQASTGQVKYTWANFATSVKCRLDMAGAGLVRKPEDIYNKATHLLFIEYRTDIDVVNFRIQIGSDNYTILQIADGGGKRNHHLELDLEKLT